MKGRLAKYGCCTLFVAVMAFVYLQSRGIAGAEEKEGYRLLCDALTVPGVLLLCAGALVWVSSLGALDGLSYGLRLAMFSLIPGKRTAREESYRDYVTRRRSSRPKGYGFLLFSGGVTVVLSLLFLGLYYL